MSRRVKLSASLTPYTGINSEWIKGLKTKPESLKLLEEKVRITLEDYSHNKHFLFSTWDFSPSGNNANN